MIRPGSDGILWPCAAPGSLGFRAWLGLPCAAATASRPSSRPRSATTSSARSWALPGTPPRPPTRFEGGQLEVSNAYNHPAWLRRRLPPNAVIDFDVVSKSPAGDIKVELYGDGESFDPDKGSYDSTGYVLIFGGWHNTLSVICRLEEHGGGRKAERDDVKVTPGQHYHFTITHSNGAIDWAIDGRPFLAWTDPEPLAGPTHEYFAINDWEADVTFDNLHIRPAP